MVEQVLTHSLVATLVCGPERILIYNDAAAQLYGALHPAALGRPLPETFPDGWGTVEAYYARAFAGEAVMIAGQALDTRGEGEASDVFDALLMPVRDGDGQVAYVHMTGAEVGAQARHRAALRAKAAIETALRESEELRRIALEAGRMGSWRWNLRDKLIGGDAAFLALWGLPPSNEPHRLSDITERMSPESQAEMGDMVSHAIAVGEEFDRQLAVVNGPTSGTWVRWRGRAERDRSWIVNGISFDVTAQRRADQRLRESEARHRLLVESWTQAVWEADAHGVVVADSPSWRAITGQTLEEWLGYGWLDAIHPDDRADAQRKWREAIAARAFVDAEFRLRAPNGGWRWTNVRATPVLDDDGNIVKWAGMNIDIDTRKRAEAALRESEGRFQQFSEASPDILWSRDAETLQWDYLSPAFEDIYGLSRGEAIEGNDLRRWLELIEPDDRHEAMACLRRVREGERVTFEFRIRRPVNGQIRWLRNTDFPIRDGSGRVRRIGGIGQDITGLKATEAALTHSEQRLRTLVEGVPQLVWRAIDHGDWTWASPQWVAFTGQPEPDSHHLGWLEPVHPDDRKTARAAWDHALEKGGFEVEYRIRNAATGEYRWFQTRATPVRDAAGEIIEWLGTSTDIHDLRAMQDRQKVLVAELQHRTRNLMGVVRAVAESTLRASADVTDFGARYRDRLDALARVQGLLSRLEGVARITFDDLIRSELKAVGAIDGATNKVTLAGPRGVALRSSTVQTFALALHELATNAVKYGALRAPSGHLAVAWRLQREGPSAKPWLHVDWHESGVVMPPADASPQGTGQGRQLIDRALPYQLGARTTYVMGSDGIRCSIALPVSSRTVAEDPDDDSASPS